MKCWVIIHCLEVSCEEDQIMSAQSEWFILLQLTDKDHNAVMPGSAVAQG